VEEDLQFDLEASNEVLFSVTAETNPEMVEKLDEAADTLEANAEMETP